MAHTFCVERKVDFDDFAIKAKYCLKVVAGNIARKTVHDDSFSILLVVAVLHVHIRIVERLWRARATSVRHYERGDQEKTGCDCDNFVTIHNRKYNTGA